MMDPRLVEYLAGLGVSSEALDGWTVHIAQRAGVDVGFVIVNGTEIHILPTCERKAMSRRNILHFVKPILDQYGYVTTRTPVTETDNRLRLRLGFQLTWCDNRYNYWALTRIPYERDPHA